MKNYFVLTVSFFLITFSGVNVFAQSKREKLKIKRPDKTVVTCLVPPPDVMTKASNTTVNAAIPKVVYILKNGGTGNAGIDRKREFERVREELSDLNTYEVIEFRLCVQYGNGVLSAEEYKEAARELTPKASLVKEVTEVSNEMRLEKVTDEPIVFSLGEWKNFAVRVVNAQGKPVAGAKVAWQIPEGETYIYEPAVKIIKCKFNYSDCFIGGANTCRKTTFTSNITMLNFMKPALPIPTYTQTSRYEIRGAENGKCTFYSKVEKSDVKYSEDFILFAVKDRGKTRQEVEQELLEERKEYQQLAGREGLCSFQTEKLIAMLNGWFPKNGEFSYSSKDFEGANCQGTLYNFTLTNQTIKSSELPPVKPLQ